MTADVIESTRFEMSPDEVRAFPVTVGIREAGRPFGMGRDASYQAAREGTFPVPVLRLGRRLICTRASILAALGITDS
jgi:hypothetical protein